jgi:DNA-binding transcriptional LysR family regulator
MTDLSQIEIFVLVVETGSFTAAARALGVSKAHVSKQVRALEDRLGARLLNRTTRKVAPTDVGAIFHDRCKRVLEELGEAETAVTDLQTAPRGMLRVTAPMAFGLNYVAPALADFLVENAELRVDMRFNDRRVDLLEEGFDLAIRIGDLPDSSLVARRIAQTCTPVCGSDAYLRRRGTPEAPEDLRQHDCLLYAYQASGQSWRLRSDRSEATVPVSGRVVADSGDAIVAAALRGLGLSFVPDFYVAEALAAGKLRRVLPEWSTPTPIWAVYPHSRHLSAKVRLFVEFLAARFETPPWVVPEGSGGRRRGKSGGKAAVRA